jgi:hypothetical protein
MSNFDPSVVRIGGDPVMGEEVRQRPLEND